MNIYALEGHKVKVTKDTFNHGCDSDKEKMKQYCEINKEFTVNYTIVGSWDTRVYLKEFPGIDFNVVNFEDVIEQSEDDDKLHDNWHYYNEDN